VAQRQNKGEEILACANVNTAVNETAISIHNEYFLDKTQNCFNVEYSTAE